MKKIIIGVSVLIIIVCGYFGLKFYADKQFVNSINKVEKDRDEMVAINKKSLDLQNQAFSKMDSLKLFTDEKISYDTRTSTLKQIQSDIDESFQFDNELSANVVKQIAELNNIKNLRFILSKDDKNALTETEQTLNQELENDKSTTTINKQEAFLVLNLLKVSVDISILPDVNSAKNIADALSVGTPYQKYTSNAFAFENEALYRADYSQPTEALNNAKIYFADYYNMLLATNSGDQQKAQSLYNSLSSKGNVMIASIQNSLDVNNPKWKDFYQSEINNSDKYTRLVEKIDEVTFNAPRENAYSIMLSVAKENNNLNKYPKAANFQELKTQLNLKYGDSNYIKYTSSGESSYTLEYLDKTTNQWIKLEVIG